MTTRWDPDKYLTFADERGRPFVDLVQRVSSRPRTIVDLGCGPGQLTRVLRERWPDAEITGVDSSAEMIDKAVRDNTDPHASYVLADVFAWKPNLLGDGLLDGKAADSAAASHVDLIVSNAMFQWVDDQLEVIRRLTEVADTIAIQVPNNFDSPTHKLMREVAAWPPYAEHLSDITFRTGTDAQTYLELFGGLGWTVDAWETNYLHVLHGDNAVFDWVSGTGARPVLQALPDGVRQRFEDDYKAALRRAYPSRPWGTVLPFARVFVIASRA